MADAAEIVSRYVSILYNCTIRLNVVYISDDGLCKLAKCIEEREVRLMKTI